MDYTQWLFWREFFYLEDWDYVATLRWSLDPERELLIPEVTYESLEDEIFEVDIFYSRDDDVTYQGIMLSDEISAVSDTDYLQKLSILDYTTETEFEFVQHVRLNETDRYFAIQNPNGEMSSDIDIRLESGFTSKKFETESGHMIVHYYVNQNDSDVFHQSIYG